MEYDEIRITTRREINVCQGAIKKLEMTIGAMERKFNISSMDFLQNFEFYNNPPNSEKTRWYECCHALERWKERLSSHWQIMDM
jgi:hypothetical protein